MANHPTIKRLYELQSGGYPLNQVLLIQTSENGQTAPAAFAFFADAEMDVFAVEYGAEGEITIHAEDVTHITTEASQLQQIVDLVPEAEALNAEISEFLTDDGEWTDYEHLLTQPKF